MQVQAAVLRGVGEPLSVETLDLAPPQKGEVLVKLAAAGVCHSDYHVISGQAGHDLPVVLGHEGAGTIVSTGPEVEGLATGDHVVLSWIPHCDRCFYCENEQRHLCKSFLDPLWAGTMPDGTCRLSKDGAPVRHLSMLASWADHAVVPQESCVPIRKDAPFEVAALLGCAVTTGVGAALNRARVKAGSAVAVFGAGGVGLSVIMGAKLAGARQIIAVDAAPEKEALARAMGATGFLEAGAQAVAQVRAMTEGRGADYVFEAVGKVAVQEACLEAVRPGGSLIFVGMPGNDETMALPSASVIRDEKLVTGSIFGSAQTGRDFARFADLYLEGRLPVDRMISRRYRLEEINEACADMLTGRSGRGVIVFEEAGDGAS
ncbi:MAG: Zn-dependent alcohol dehydrogenase [Pseudomonadota bacterium]